MDQGTPWKLRRYATLLMVLMVHAALIAALLTVSRPGVLSAPPEQPVQLMILPPVTLPKIRSESPQPKQLNAPVAIAVAPPMLHSLEASFAASSPGSPDGKGAGVDWAAEARRALQAFEIRSHPPESYSSVSREPGEDTWWPRGQHHAGDKFKTPNGDWIVWVNANCYQVASAASIGYAQGAALSRTVCQDAPANETNPKQ